MDAWPIGSAPAGATMQGSFKVGAAVLTNVRLLLPFTSQWVTTSGNVKTTHTAAHMLVCVLHLMNRIVLDEQDKLSRMLQIRFVQQERTIEFKTKRHNLGRMLLVARRWGVPVQGRLVADQARERKWALGPIRWIPFIAMIYLALVSGGYFIFSDDNFFSSVKDGGGSLYPIGVWLCVLCAVWSVYRVRRWILTYQTGDLLQLVDIGVPSSTHPHMGVVS